MIAKFLKEVPKPGVYWTRYLYEVSPPLEYRDVESRHEKITRASKYLLAATSAHNRESETVLFPCDEEGNRLTSDPLTGSIRGDRNPDNAVRKQGYIVNEGVTTTINEVEDDPKEPEQPKPTAKPIRRRKRPSAKQTRNPGRGRKT